MKLQILGCAGGLGPGRRLSSYLLEGRLLIDAGGLDGIPPEQPQAVLLTHAHLDHVMHFPLLLTSRLSRECRTLPVHCSSDTLRRLRLGLLSDKVYPDHSRLKTRSGELNARYQLIDGPFRVLDYEVTPLPMVHAYTCYAFAIRRGSRGLIVGGDTSESGPMWDFARANKWVKSVLVEVSFPNGFEELCLRAGHLTPAMLRDQLKGFRRRSVEIHVVHVKPEMLDRVRDELTSLFGKRVQLASDGQTIRIG